MVRLSKLVVLAGLVTFASLVVFPGSLWMGKRAQIWLTNFLVAEAVAAALLLILVVGPRII